MFIGSCEFCLYLFGDRILGRGEGILWADLGVVGG